MAEASNALSAYASAVKNESNIRIAESNAQIEYRKRQRELEEQARREVRELGTQLNAEIRKFDIFNSFVI